MTVQMYSPAVRSAETKTSRIDGVVIGLLVGFENDVPLVVYPENPKDQATTAKSTTALQEQDIGREVALLFEGGDSSKPLVVGRIHQPPARQTETKFSEPLQLSVDGETVALTAKSSISLKCGRASVTLTKAGKIIVKGTYISTRSSGVNRIKGGSVQIN